MLWEKFDECQYPQQLTTIIQDLYNQTEVVVRTNCGMSQQKSVSQGVRKGCSISPTLFNIFIEDLVRKWRQQRTLVLRYYKTDI